MVHRAPQVWVTAEQLEKELGVQRADGAASGLGAELLLRPKGLLKQGFRSWEGASDHLDLGS